MSEDNESSGNVRGAAQCGALIAILVMGISRVLATWIEGVGAVFVFESCGFLTAWLAGSYFGPRLNADLGRSRTTGHPYLTGDETGISPEEQAIAAAKLE